MWDHLWSVLALALLCAAWVVLQLWLARLDPEGGRAERRCGGCARDCRDEP